MLLAKMVVLSRNILIHFKASHRIVPEEGDQEVPVLERPSLEVVKTKFHLRKLFGKQWLAQMNVE